MSVVDVGTVLDERYRLVELIAVGGMGEVWRGEDDVLGRTVAIKVLRDEHAGDPDFDERFKAEARHAASLSHPGIASVFDYGETATDRGRAAYLVMELVDGTTLAAMLSERGTLDVDTTLGILAGAASALQAAHEAGVVHRDVKPANILVRPDGSVALTDFGIARITNEPSHLTRTGLVVGTAYYLSPEQANGRPITAASDIYSLGVVAYECLAGRRPFEGDNPVQVAVAHIREEPDPLPEAVPSAVRRLVDDMLAKDPAARPATAADVERRADDLRVDPEHDPVEATAVSLTGGAPGDETAMLVTAEEAIDESRPRWRSDAYPDQRRTRQLFALAGLVVVLVGAVLLALVSSGDGSPKPAAKTTPSASRPSTVRVDPALYVGQPYATVRRDLVGRGLAVRRSDLESKAVAGTVIAVTPHGRVPVGDTVTVVVAVAPPPPPKPPDHGHGHGHGKDGDG